ncbi:AAA family ATPase [Tenacibaculum finnmarkense]|uniref:AAA family ATPase n=1 Tax=Tenacibaculum finnmarkense TaxID=2781243 RepID=UPI001EFA480C|nr:AAA family ATPase [Tenacibaculum finnmarkense]MCG8750426.1 AAA family ATPase [Tenacibaculum finnmarkense]MCG8755278.1 AAA family ATPase [Tenacibaculum finnmarkense]MCG8783653.1 AAA family ATPase [Tenacibaculum finnmarkense]
MANFFYWKFWKYINNKTVLLIRNHIFVYKAKTKMDSNAVYIADIETLSYKNFNEITNINFKKENGEIYPWTIFLGNNGTGKTNLLKVLSSFESSVYNINENLTRSYPKYININHKYKVNFKIKTGIFFWESNIINNGGFIEGTNEPIALRLLIYAYGVNRKSSRKTKLSSDDAIENNATLFNHNISLINLEEWLLQTDYAVKNGQKTAQKRLDLIKEIITGAIFPELQDFRFQTDEQLNNSVEFKTEEGWFQFDDLAYGYQSTLSWIVDFCKKMFDRYPKSSNPLKEPAIVLIDEIDLHLHPEWQRNITQILSNLFPKTQFIATTHSPIVVQSLEEANVYILNKEAKNVSITRMPNKTFRGWSVEDILNKVMGLKSKVKSDEYLTLIEQFDNALDAFNFEDAKNAFDKLMEILPENDIQRRVLDMQIRQFPEARD